MSMNHGASRPTRNYAQGALLAAVLFQAPGISAATLDVCSSGCTYSSIQAAVNAAVSGDLIEVTAGQYGETLTISKDLTIRGAGQNDVVVDAGGAGSTLTVTAGASVTVEDLTITGGSALDGAGVLNDGALTLRRVSVQGNTANDPGAIADGGGIATSSTLLILDSTITGNTADRGGGVWSVGGVVTIERSFITENVARNHGGGGVAGALSTTSLTIRNTVIEGNQVTAPGTDQRGGGGVWANQADLVLEDVEVTNNSSGYSAGGVYISGSSVVASLTRVTIAGNLTGTDRGVGRGGGISTRSSARVTITDSTISGNTSASGGGGIDASSLVTILNSTISGNAAADNNVGGGISVDGPVTLDSVTIANNSAGYGGGIGDAGRAAILRNVLVADNTAAILGPDCYRNVFVDADQVSLIEDLTDCIVGGTGTMLSGTDPQLGALGDNGGTTETQSPAANSPAVDSGVTDLVTDQRGLARPFGPAPDLGAVEVQDVAVPGADLSAVLVPDNLDIGAGLTQEYEVTVINDGPDDATAVLLVVDFSGDIVPQGLPSECVFDAGTTRIVCGLSTLANNDIRIFRLPLLFPSGGQQTVTATVSSDVNDPVPGNDEAFGVVNVLGGSGAGVAAVLGVAGGIDNNDAALAGAAVLLDVGASNVGPNVATGVEVLVQLPPGWGITRVDPRCTAVPAGPSVTCDFGNLGRPVDPRFPTTKLARLELVAGSDGDIVTTATTTATDPAAGDNTEALSVDVRDESVDLRVARTTNIRPVFSVGPTVQKVGYRVGPVPPVPVEPRITVRVSPTAGLLDVVLEDLDPSWNCVENVTTVVTFTCDTAQEPLTEFFGVALETDRPGDWFVNVAVESGLTYDPTPGNNSLLETLTWLAPPALSVRAIEVNQAIQDWQLSVDLYANRKTGVRVYLEDPESLATPVTGKLFATRGGAPLTPASIDAFNIVYPSSNAQSWRGNRNRSLNFLLPDTWTSEGAVRLRFEPDASSLRSFICSEPVGAPDCAVDVTFLPGQVVALDFVNIPYVTDDSQRVVISPTGDTAVTGTWRFVDGNRTSPPLGVDATREEVRDTIETFYSYQPGEVRVLTAKNLGENEAGWRIQLFTGQNEPSLSVTGASLIGGSIARSTGYDGGNASTGLSSGSIFDQLERLKSLLPISGIDVQFFTAPAFDRRPITGLDVNPMLETYRVGLMVGCPGGCRPADLRVGGYLDDAGGNYGAAGTNTGAVYSNYTNNIRGTDTGYTRNVGPHELAHSFGQPHAAVQLVPPDPPEEGEEPGESTLSIGICGSLAPASAAFHPFIERLGYTNRVVLVDDFDPKDWPTIGPLEDSGGENSEIWGMETRYLANGPSLAVVSPRDAVGALMSYCGSNGQHKWIAVNEYADVYQGIVNNTVGVQRDETSGDRLIVSGVIDSEGQVHFGPIVGAVGADVTFETGPLEIALIDGSGAVLDNAWVQTQRTPGGSEAVPGEPVDTLDVELFSAVLDAPPAEAAALVVRRDTTEIGRRSASPNAPTVQLEAPGSGTVVGPGGLTVAWNAQDADGDELKATITYTRNGVDWRTVGLDVPGNEWVVPITQLGASDSAQVRVVVSDGLRTAMAVSQPFVVQDASPIVAITAPAEGIKVGAVEAVLFEGMGYDAEEGLLSDGEATWSSSIDGPLGVGDSLVVSGGTLSSGCHTIQLSLVDSQGNAGTATIELGVDVPCEPLILKSDFE